MIRILAGLVLVLAVLAGWQRGTVAKAQREADRATTELAAAQAALTQAHNIIEAERTRAQRLAEIGAAYELEKADAQAAADRTVADLLAGTAQLHQRWQACAATAQLSGAAAGTVIAHDRAADRAASAGRAIAAAAACDAQVRGLQAVVKADRAALK